MSVKGTLILPDFQDGARDVMRYGDIITDLKKKLDCASHCVAREILKLTNPPTWDPVFVNKSQFTAKSDGERHTMLCLWVQEKKKVRK